MVVLLGLGACLAALAAPVDHQVMVRERLDTPATQSALAAVGILNGVALAGKRIVAVGQRGHILVSDDGGNRWRQVPVPVSSDLTAVHFASPMKGWAVGHDGVVLATADGGLTWTKQLDGRSVARIMLDHYVKRPPPALAGSEGLTKLQEEARRFAEEGPDKPFLDVWFEGELVGYAVGAFNLILRTVDGGQNWIPWIDRTENAKQLHFYAVRQVGADLYLTGEQGIVLKLDRSAERFRAVSPGYNGTLFGIAGNRRTLLVFGLRGNLFRSDDGGSNWLKLETGLAVALTAATVADDGRIVLVSQGGDVLVSSDDGKVFTRSRLSPPIASTAVVSPTAQTLVMVGPRGAHTRPLQP